MCICAHACAHYWHCVCGQSYGDLVPKGEQVKKRTEVLENKVDGMWVSNAFYLMNTCEVIHQWREKAVLLFIPEKFDFQCNLWQYVEPYTLQQAHITVLLIMQLTAKTQLILQNVIHMSITKWTVVVLCHTEQHDRHGLLHWITFNLQPFLNIFKWIKSNTFCNINSYSLIEQYAIQGRFVDFFPLKFERSWHKQQMM